MNEQTKELEVVRQVPTRALSVDAQENIDNFRAIQYAAKLMMKSGCFADIKGPGGQAIDEEVAIAKAVVKIAIGRDYGFSCAESMQYIELIQGRPSIAAHARAAKMKAAGYSWRFVKFDATVCNLVVSNPKGVELGDSVFTMEDARRMNLAAKDNWIKNPRNMLYCRAISNAQRWYAPEVLSASLATKEDVLDGDYTVIEEQPQLIPGGAADAPRKTGTEGLKDKLKAHHAEQRADVNQAPDPAGQDTPQPSNAAPPAAPAPPAPESPAPALAPQPAQPAAQGAPTQQPAAPDLFEDRPPAAWERVARPVKTYQSGEELPDAFDMKVGSTAILIEGNVRKVVRVVEEPGEAPVWKTIESTPVEPAPQAGPQAVPPADAKQTGKARGFDFRKGGGK